MPTKEGLVFKIRGMDCAEEVAMLKSEIGPLVGGESNLGFDILNGKMSVLESSSTISGEVIVKAVGRTGMTAEVWKDTREDPTERGLWQRRGRAILTGASGILTATAFLMHAYLAGGWSEALGSEGMGIAHSVPLPVRELYGAAILCGGWYVFPKAWFAVKRLRPDMNLLMTLAVVGAAVIGEWFEAATVSFLFGVSLTLEAWSVGRARRAVEALLDLTSTTVRVRRDDKSESDLPPADVTVNSNFIVRPGEKIPLDGEVVEGSSDVNQAPITGESVPVSKEPGAQVFAGTINGDGALVVRSTKLAGDTTLANIIRMVGEAQSRRAPSEQWVEKFARFYTPVVLGAAVLIALVPLLTGSEWNEWIYRSLVLLVIGCPCALVISTPVSIVAALTASAKKGVLVKGGIHMESPAHLKAIALDKTGTLTEGKPRVVEMVAVHDHSETELLERAGAMEALSDHPLARAISEYVRERGVPFASAENFQIMQGKGATARFNGKLYWLGSHRLLEERGQETPEVHAKLEEMSRAGRTVVVLGTEEHVCGYIGLADTVRPEARTLIQELRRLGLDHIVMLTGDNEGTARAIAVETGVDEVHAELLPADKIAAVEELVSKYGSVAMIGDGINDAPAMGRATLGIAMGAAGSDAAIEAADVALMSDDLSKLPWLIQHSRRTLAIIRQNIGLSLAVKALFVVLTFVGVASLWGAIAADMGVSLLVIFNALRLLK